MFVKSKTCNGCQGKITTNIRGKCALTPIVSANTARQSDGPRLSSARLLPDVTSLSGMDGSQAATENGPIIDGRATMKLRRLYPGTGGGR